MRKTRFSSVFMLITPIPAENQTTDGMLADRGSKKYPGKSWTVRLTCRDGNISAKLVYPIVLF
jgi:hypothetical protein